MISTIITGSGHYLPTNKIKNSDFLDHQFYENDEPIKKSNQEVIDKFESITEIAERRYVDNDMVCSDIATEAAKAAIADAKIDKEDLDYIILAHNFGDLKYEYRESDFMPSLSARVKHNLRIKNPRCKPYDMIFGCPGWIEGLILGHQFISGGIAKNILVIGAETLSRVTDPHDKDSMIFADGAGAVVLQAKEAPEKTGIIGHLTQSDMGEELGYLSNSPSLKKDYEGSKLNIRMKGRKIYEYALKNVPNLVKELLDNHKMDLSQIKKVLIHQANAKMDYAILDRLSKLYNLESHHEEIAPMTIQNYGNSSVATIPTLYDKLMKKTIGNHTVDSGDYIVMASVGAGMNINALLYKMP